MKNHDTTNPTTWEKERRKPKILIIGHARHGKDTFADLIVSVMDLSFVSSSEFVGRVAIWPIWGKERYTSFSDMFEDRINFRSTWFNLITAYNTPDLARTGREMMAKHDVYVGMRNPDEFHACMKENLFDYVIWVDGSARHPSENKKSNGMTVSMADLHIDNNGPQQMLDIAVFNLQKRLHEEGYEVNYTPSVEGWDDSYSDEGLDKPMNDQIEETTDEKIGTKAITERSNAPPLDPKFTAVEDNSLAVGDLLEIPWEQNPEGTLKVLDHGFFGVLEIMGSDQTICESARMSYGRGTKKVSNDKNLINYLVRNGHTSPLEMGEIRFHIRMPIFVMRQWVRHRTANLNEYSGRYSEMVPLWYVPENEQICLQDKVNKQGSSGQMAEIHANNIRNEIDRVSKAAFETYKGFLQTGLSRETARMVLPLNTYTEVVWKLDISNLIKFLRLRDDDHAQWEIRQYAILVAKAVKEYFPLVYAAYLEARQSQTLTMDEVRALTTGDYDNLSKSQSDRIMLLRQDIFN